MGQSVNLYAHSLQTLVPSSSVAKNDVARWIFLITTIAARTHEDYVRSVDQCQITYPWIILGSYRAEPCYVVHFSSRLILNFLASSARWASVDTETHPGSVPHTLEGGPAPTMHRQRRHSRRSDRLRVSIRYLGAGRGGRTPTRLPSADFEFPDIPVSL
jgi:hypothetical protein